MFRRHRRQGREDAAFIAGGSIGSALTRECLVVLRDRLEQVGPGWRLGGPGLVGPDRLGVEVVEHWVTPQRVHVDIVVLLDHTDTEAGAIGDCAVAVKADGARSDAVAAVDYWFRTTAPVIFELLDQHGRFADHYRGTDSDGLAGWHIIHGPIQGWGTADHPDRLAQWTLAHPLLPQLPEPLLAALAGSELASVRIFFGGNGVDDVAEVQVGGTVDEDVSRALYEAEWPRPEGVGYVKVFLLAIHPEHT